MQIMNKIKIFSVIFLSLYTLTLSAKDYKASLFGIKSEGFTLNTRSIQKAVDFISENGGGKLIFYVGRYLTGTIELKSNVTIELKEGAVLIATSSVYDYFGVKGTRALIMADGQQNIGIFGKGVIEGQGATLLEQIEIQIQKGYLRETITQASPSLIAMNNCTQITLDQFNLMAACGNALSISGCKNLTCSRLSVISTAVKGSKGIVIDGCDGVHLTGLYFETSGEELSSAGISKNISVTDCKNKNGKMVQLKN